MSYSESKRPNKTERTQLTIEMVMDENPEAILLEGMDEALVGCASDPFRPIVAIYSDALIIGILMNRDKMDYGQALEWIEDRIAGAWGGENTPIVMRTACHVIAEPTKPEDIVFEVCNIHAKQGRIEIAKVMGDGRVYMNLNAQRDSILLALNSCLKELYATRKYDGL